VSACPCESCRDPRVVANPPGLETIAYRVDDFAGFRHALLHARLDEHALAGWHPAPGDLGLQLLEWWAYLSDVLAFYNERIANEDYLRTAELSASVARLVSLLGYVPRPAIAATGRVAAVRSNARPHEALVVPAGMQLASTATPGTPVETFESAAASFSGRSDGTIVLNPSPTLLSNVQPPAADEESFRASILLQGSLSGVAPGDALLAMPRDPVAVEQNWVGVTVVSTMPEPSPGGGSNTRLELEVEGPWWITGANAADARLVRITRSTPLWSATTDAPLTTDGTTLFIRLVSVERSISTGDVAFLQGDGWVIGLRVIGTSDEFLGAPYPGATGSPAQPPDIPVLHTVVAAETPWATVIADGATATSFGSGVKDVGTPIGSPTTTLDSLPASATAPDGLEVPAGGGEAFVEDVTGAGIPLVATAGSDGTIALAAFDDTPASFALTAPFRLLLDLVDVSRGQTVSAEVLGTGDASIAGQSFTLKKSPLTYLAKGAGWASTLSISVDSYVWREVESFYGQPPDARVFVVAQQPDGTSNVRFGDGESGARLPTGGQVLATYRYGAGEASPPAGRLTTILKPQPNLASIRNPVAVWGGADAQSPDDVRANAPASVLTFGRAISADDYETVAALAPGVTRARAYWTWDVPHQRALVKVYAGDDAGAAEAARSALAGAEDPNRPVAVVPATPIELTVSCTLEVSSDRVPADVAAAAGDALTALFAPATMGIGRPLFASEVEGALFVSGVEAVHGLSVSAAGAEIFATEPVGWADPGEGAFYVLTASTITPVAADG
jgi:hypothetical protein